MQKAAGLWDGGNMILGSDTPYGNGNISKNIQRIENLKIGDAAKERILGGNILSLIRRRL